MLFWPHYKKTIPKDNILKLSPSSDDSSIIPINKKSKFTIKEFPFRHIENTYYDEDKELLIPERLSQEGPASIYADFNKDGIKDFFIGGAKEQPLNALWYSKWNL